MPDADTLTAIAVIISAITSLVTAIAVAFNTRTTNSTHKLVNAQADSNVAYQATLTENMTAGGMTVPPNPNIAAARERIAQEGGGTE
jgi:hypothetical protein